MVLAVIGVGTALAQAPAPAAGAGPQWKDQAEYDLFQTITKEADATKRLSTLESWKEKYPDSAFKQQRLLIYMTTYQALTQTPKAVATAKEILAADPKDPNALYYLTNYGQMNPATPDSLETGEKAAKSLMALEKPAAVTDENQWKQMKKAFDVTSHTTLAFIAIQKKDLNAAETEYKAGLEVDPGNAQTAYALGSAIIAQKKPERYPEALFFLARAAYMTGPGALQPAVQKQVETYFLKIYNTYHGKDDAGLAQLKQLAVGPKPAPPDGFSIKNVNEIEAEKQQADAAKDPLLAKWKAIKDALMAPNGMEYFETGVKGAELPQLRGKVVSMKPALRPKEVVLEMDGDSSQDVTLKFETPLPGKAEPGTEIRFVGIPSAFTKEPFMLTFDVEGKDKLEGWPASAPAAPVRRPAAKKK